LRLPPVIAPIQAVVIVVREDEGVSQTARSLVEQLTAAGVRARLDADTSTSFGRRATDWELKGVPLRFELGPRDLADNKVTMVRRDLREKSQISLAAVVSTANSLLASMQTGMLDAAEQRLRERTADVATLDEAREACETGFARLPFSVANERGEVELARSGITVRCIQRADGSVPMNEDEPDLFAIVAKAY
jgi:prolyl-tRNA synthetase